MELGLHHEIMLFFYNTIILPQAKMGPSIEQNLQLIGETRKIDKKNELYENSNVLNYTIQQQSEISLKHTYTPCATSPLCN